jgi:hypothetical protein
MWGASSPDDELTGDLGNVIEATQIGGRRPNRLMAKLSPGSFGLLQQYRHECDLRVAPTNVRSWESNGLNADIAFGPFMTRNGR